MLRQDFPIYKVYWYDWRRDLWMQTEIAGCPCSPDCEDLLKQTRREHIAKKRLEQLHSWGYTAMLAKTPDLGV